MYMHSPKGQSVLCDVVDFYIYFFQSQGVISWQGCRANNELLKSNHYQDYIVQNLTLSSKNSFLLLFSPFSVRWKSDFRCKAKVNSLSGMPETGMHEIRAWWTIKSTESIQQRAMPLKEGKRVFWECKAHLNQHNWIWPVWMNVWINE